MQVRGSGEVRAVNPLITCRAVLRRGRAKPISGDPRDGGLNPRVRDS